MNMLDMHDTYDTNALLNYGGLLAFDTATKQETSAPTPPADVTMTSTILCCAKNLMVSLTPLDTMFDV